MSFLDGPEHAAVWYRAAVRAAELETAQFDVADAKAAKYLQVLPQTAALWRYKDYSTLGQRFAIERRLFPPLSKESRKAGHLAAEMDHYKGRREESLQKIEQVARENDSVGDLTHEDRVESAWTRGLIMAMARRDTEAIQLLKFVVEQHYAGFPHVPEATATLILTLARAKRVDEAERLLPVWSEIAKPGVAERLSLMNEIELAKTELR